VGTTPMVAEPYSGTQASAHPPIAGAPTATMPQQPGPDLGEYPPGASPEARYYQDSNSRTGWYALAAFIALIALVAGGVLLYQGLTRESSESSALVLDNYVNQPLERATGALDALGLPYRVIAEENPQFAPDFVHRTVPVAGTIVPEGRVIELYYNPTDALVAVPNVNGRTIEEASAILGTAGFSFVEVRELSDVAEGLVVRTDPAADTRVQQDTVITVVVSGGPEQVSIPATVIGDEEAVARSLLESDAYGLVVTTVERVDDVIPAGIVIDTNPPPNTLVERGSTVELIVSSGPGQVRVPPLVGLTEGQARNSLDEEGLGADVSYQELEPGAPEDGTVLEQSIPPTQEVDKGTVISLVVGQARIAETTTTTSTTTTTTTVPPTTTTPPTTTSPATTTTPTETTTAADT
ncbi:PASTA domain-containing protein, partial [Ilumatobacter sp.]|uniref:PASTA domain-containing protein n=1 Tax=Ilumatobacter sp. TaxID=1967498 RepID=UPI003AF5DC17